MSDVPHQSTDAKKFMKGDRQIYKQIYKLTSQLLEIIGLKAYSLKISAHIRPLKKSRIQETLKLLTCADSSTDTRTY